MSETGEMSTVMTCQYYERRLRSGVGIRVKLLRTFHGSLYTKSDSGPASQSSIQLTILYNTFEEEGVLLVCRRLVYYAYRSLCTAFVQPQENDGTYVITPLLAQLP